MHNSTLQVSNDIAQLCIAHGVGDVVITPGSRNAPLAMAFKGELGLSCWSLIDERSAAFFALGMAQAYRRPVALCCTSGTALLNFYPAVAEAFYQGIPLLILSADRPLEKIDQQIGQSVRQVHSMSLHVKKSIQLVEAVDDGSLVAYNQRQINEGLLALTATTSGPVHINIPLREPLYEQRPSDLEPPRVIQHSSTEKNLKEEAWQEVLSEWEQASQVMILAGMYPEVPRLSQALEQLAKTSNAVVLADWVSGLSGEQIITEIDKTLAAIDFNKQAFQPDLVISYGNGLVSKNIKRFLQKYPPRYHWFIQPEGEIIDTNESLTRVIPTSPEQFFPEWVHRISMAPSSFSIRWKEAYQNADELHQDFLSSAPFSDLYVFSQIHSHLPDDWCIQLGNSSVIRYMQLFPKPLTLTACLGNRGTSGIDGSTSTALGYTAASKHPTLLISGDVSFFYDANAWWNPYIPSHFRAIVIHNGGGGIFRLIDGPEKGGILEDFQETPHLRSAKNLAKEHGIGYQAANGKQELSEILQTFFLPSDKAHILEVFTPRYENGKVWRTYLEKLKSLKAQGI